MLKAFLGVLTTPLFFGVPIFLAAGTLNYPAGWAFISVFTLSTAFLTLYLAKNDPALLQRRMQFGPHAEQRPAQRIIMILVMIGFALAPILSSLDFRFGWSQVPTYSIVLGNLLVAASYGIFCEVMRENSFAAATIRVESTQKVVSSGLYGIVRHPMYAGSLVLMLGMPLALASYWGLLAIIITLPVLHWRIIDEEKMLNESLEGYSEYCDKIKYRMIPGIY